MLRKIPNILTVGRILIVPFFVLAFYLPGFYGDLTALILFIIASFTDFLDGMLARLLGEESFHRAGGFAAACPIRDDDLSFKKGARKATALERTPNIAKKALAKYKITSKDILMIVSNSGVNHAPVEAALIAKKKKIKTILRVSGPWIKCFGMAPSWSGMFFFFPGQSRPCRQFGRHTFGF